LKLARSLAIILALGLASAAHADDMVTCKDGTKSKGGSGACSGHGGIDKKASSAKAKAPKEATPAAAAPAETPTKAKKAAAPETTDKPMVTCKDGTTSKGGSGACSGHGGIDKKAKSAPAAAPAAAPSPAAPKPTPAPAPQTASPKPAADGSSKGNPKNTDPAGAIAKCKDGTYSHAKGHSGACSNHGGVGEWLDKKE